MDAHTTSTFITGDRFIPSRSSSNFALIDLPSSSSQSSSSAYINLLNNACFGNDSNIFKYKIETSRRALTRFDDDPGVPLHPVKATRKVPSQPYKVLDAPELLDDFYSNILDWSLSNVLSVALRNRVYLWHHSSNKVEMLFELDDDSTVCSVGWAQCNAHLAVGTSTGELQIWDVSRLKRIRTMGGHSQRVGAIAWSSSLLSSGSRDKSILQRDIRAQEDSVSKLSGHKSEVCGLKWSDDNCDLAYGGNDHQLFVWKQNRTQPVLKFREHTAAVRAIAWSPHRDGLLASGGGMADRCIRIWNTTTDSLLSCVDTGSTVCNLAWSKNVNELVSTHGCNQDHIVVWRYPKMSKFATLTGHKAVGFFTLLYHQMVRTLLLEQEMRD